MSELSYIYSTHRRLHGSGVLLRYSQHQKWQNITNVMAVTEAQALGRRITFLDVLSSVPSWILCFFLFLSCLGACSILRPEVLNYYERAGIIELN